MKSSAQLLYEFIEMCEASDVEMKDFSKEGLERCPESTVYQKSIEYHDGRLKAFAVVKTMMTDHYFQTELSTPLAVKS